MSALHSQLTRTTVALGAARAETARERETAEVRINDLRQAYGDPALPRRSPTCARPTARFPNERGPPAALHARRFA